MDLTRRTCLGLLKYPALCPPSRSNTASLKQNYLIKAKDWKPVKAIYQDDAAAFNWVLDQLPESEKKAFVTTENNKTLYKSFDASIMELADDIAYGVHDLEDAIVLNYVSQQQWLEQALPQLQNVDNLWSQKYSAQLSKMLFSSKHHERKNAIGALVNHLITNIEIKVISDQFNTPQLKYNACLSSSAEPLLKVLKQFVFNNLIMNSEIQQLEFRGQRMLMAMFDAFATDPQRLLPEGVKSQYEQSTSKHRVICDYLASMSDQQAVRTYNKMFADNL